MFETVQRQPSPEPSRRRRAIACPPHGEAIW